MDAKKVARIDSYLASLAASSRVSTAGSVTSASPKEGGVGAQSGGKQETLQRLQRQYERYASNTAKEAVVFHYARHFEKQYVTLFPMRPRLLLSPRNEFGVRKFVSTFLIPSLLPYADVYDAGSCALFVADHITYVPFGGDKAGGARPHRRMMPSVSSGPDVAFAAHLPPEHICSPTMTLSTQRGDAFDMSVLLCSLLLGAGYNAYVAYGFVTSGVASNRTKERWRCPDGEKKQDVRFRPKVRVKDRDCDREKESKKEGDRDRDHEEHEHEGGCEEKEEKPSKYVLKSRVRLTSRFEEEGGVSQSASASASGSTSGSPREEPAVAAAAGDAEEEEGEGEVLDAMSEGPGTREEEQETDDDDLEVAIHSWIVVLSGKRGVEEPFFIEPSTGSVLSISDNKYVRLLAMWNHENYYCYVPKDLRPSTSDSFDLTDGSQWEFIFLQDDDLLDRRPSAGSSVSASAVLEKKRKESESQSQCPASASEEEDCLDVPLSWCNPLSISKERFLSRFPSKTKAYVYRNLKVTYSAPFHEKDLAVKDLSLFYVGPDGNIDQSRLSERYVLFAKRRDKLEKRVMEYRPDGSVLTVHEWFSPGRKYSATELEGLGEIVRVSQKKRVFKFYNEARLDGLEQIVQKFSRSKAASDFVVSKVLFHFKDREDFLQYRSATYDVESVPPKILKMAEKFGRNRLRKPDNDVAKLVFLENEFRVLYHFGDGRITRSSKIHRRDCLDVSVNIVDKSARLPSRAEAMEEFAALGRADKQCEEEISRLLGELDDVLKRRSEEEASIKCETDIYDVLQNRPTEDELRDLREQERLEAAKKERRDPLAHHLRSDETVRDRRHAQRLYQAVVEQTRDILLERAQIMADRLREEKNAMNRERVRYQKREAAARGQEEFIKYWEQAMFKLRILEKRVKRNESDTVSELDKTRKSLLDDPRLAEFLQEEKDLFIQSVASRKAKEGK